MSASEVYKTKHVTLECNERSSLSLKIHLSHLNNSDSTKTTEEFLSHIVYQWSHTPENNKKHKFLFYFSNVEFSILSDTRIFQQAICKFHSAQSNLIRNFPPERHYMCWQNYIQIVFFLIRFWRHSHFLTLSSSLEFPSYLSFSFKSLTNN